MDLVDDINLVLDENDDEIVNILNRRPYNSQNRHQQWDNLNCWDDLDFFQRFRLTKQAVLETLPLVEEGLLYQSNRNNPIPPLQQLLLALRFYATGGFYVSVGDFGNIHKTTAAKIIKRVTSQLARLRQQFIYMPSTQDEKISVQRKFMRIARFPRVIGAIDCTHIKIQSTGGQNAEGQNAEVYRNRKGFFSLNVQCICDANNKIRDIVARWPGSSHDANIFDNSNIKQRFEANEFGNGVLLGDSAYPLRQYLITPIANQQNDVDNLFNEAQIRTRGAVERTFGIWKRRFPCLSIGMRCKIPMVQNIIVATAVLHNIARNNRFEDNEALFENGNIQEVEEDIVIDDNNNLHRAEFLNYFRNL